MLHGWICTFETNLAVFLIYFRGSKRIIFIFLFSVDSSALRCYKELGK